MRGPFGKRRPDRSFFGLVAQLLVPCAQWRLYWGGKRVARGAVTIGCVWCGGGAQFDASCYRILRRTAPDLWRRFVVNMRGGEIILSVKHRAHLQTVRAALERLGGLARVASERPWVFDFLQMPPRRNYDR